jgi:hypothetical protein
MSRGRDGKKERALPSPRHNLRSTAKLMEGAPAGVGILLAYSVKDITLGRI